MKNGKKYKNGGFRLMVRPYTVDVEMSVRFCQATFVNMGVWCNGSTLHF